MKSFFEWFKASTKVKRWILLIIVGVVLTCYGIAKILTSEEISFFELGKTIVIFIIGFIAIVTSVIFIQKRSLELIIEANNTSERGRQAQSSIKSLIFNRNVYEEGPKVVIIGGGQGLNNIIEGFKHYTNNITAIVTMSDYGNSSINARKDIKDALISISSNQNEMKSLMDLNFRHERLRGLNFSDIYFVAMTEIYGNIAEAISKSKDVLNISGTVIPATLDEISVHAELADGTTIDEKDKIAEIVASKKERIKRIYTSPSNCKPAPGVVESIASADVIIIGPGSLYTNVLPSLLIRNIAREIKDSKATKYYISNIMTEPGQTDDFAVSDHLRVLQDHIGSGIIDYCLADTGEVIPEYIRKYNKEGSDLVDIDNKKLSEFNVKLIQRNMSCIKDGKIMHNSDIVASTIIEMICNDLKFHDMQNDTQYLLLQSVLKEQKKLQQKQQKALVKVSKRRILNQEKPKHQEEKNKESKFKEKYSERVKSIQNTDARILENRKVANQIEKLEKTQRELNKTKSRRTDSGKRKK